jgi:hypothetical protein
MEMHPQKRIGGLKHHGFAKGKINASKVNAMVACEIGVVERRYYPRNVIRPCD